MKILNSEPNWQDIEKQNEVVAQWSSMVQRHLRGATVILQHGKDNSISRPAKAPVRTESKLENSIISRSRQNFGITDRVSIKFERHGVFVHKGVGRGYQMKGGMVIRTPQNLIGILKNKRMTVPRLLAAKITSRFGTGWWLRPRNTPIMPNQPPARFRWCC